MKKIKVDKETRELSKQLQADNLQNMYNESGIAFVFADGKLLQIEKED